MELVKMLVQAKDQSVRQCCSTRQFLRNHLLDRSMTLQLKLRLIMRLVICSNFKSNKECVRLVCKQQAFSVINPPLIWAVLGGIPGAFSQSQHPAAAAAPPLAPPAVAAAPKPSAGGVLGTVPPVTAAAPVPSSSTGFPITFTSTAPVTTAASLPSSAPSVTSTSSVPTTTATSGTFPCSLVTTLMQ
ncbi:hypothetical protein COOONC_09036 [Cooperia oncophora]